ncbi:MAG: NUDIX domain-containing protein [Candidatus Dojkabacteria bacterium]
MERPSNDHKNEIIDVVNDNDEVLKQISREDSYTLLGEGEFVRVVNAFIVNSKGELWIPKRTATKRNFPNCLDFSCGGYVQAGETYEDALKEELKEELNLETENIELMGYLSPIKDGVAAFMRVYKISQDEPPVFNTDDVQSAEWISPHDLAKKLEAGTPAKSDIMVLLKHFFL